MPACARRRRTHYARHKPRPPPSSTQSPLPTASHDVPHIASLLLGSVAVVTNLTRSANVSSYPEYELQTLQDTSYSLTASFALANLCLQRLQ
ncbi:hypothetical protein HETIRDRAFT_107700 [Heterobasidion irregulare TC 32-1]|uniref:Uncharacterized protein n=1 Tax=Heterobasidion irregulare (strain TC 32-1) TaxID=747525 RepID=W4JX09_HETIT|nr:uncharacterized protein HETIRDRAFT_107700 [Heterobasidion irregulare TC 32-1]ETW78093.1 hypothetical protein HETIRDRAFT_107700 [Heterobasidion irregulare TC 32-1]